MRIYLINVAHPAIGSRSTDDHLPPLGLLAIGGPLIDDGHDVRLLDVDLIPMPKKQIVEKVARFKPDAVLFGHFGSTAKHPVIAEISRLVANALPSVAIIYGGVYPTYHWREILAREPHVTAVVRGEGEETTRQLIQALETEASLLDIPGLAVLQNGCPVSTSDARIINNLDDYRTGWELIETNRYRYWGGKRAVVASFSRGCSDLCNNCGQPGFWAHWRHRDPVKFAQELARLHREQGVELINLADENPTRSRRAWKAFLEALIAQKVDLLIVGSTHASDIVRDKDILHLYREAGCIQFLLGLENSNAQTPEMPHKGSTKSINRIAIQLLRMHGMISMATWVVGFEGETDIDRLRGLKQLLSYDPDQIRLRYVAPHRGTDFDNNSLSHKIIQGDPCHGDYEHQVLDTRNMPSWRVFLWVKFIEAALQTRPKAFFRTFLHPDPELRHAMCWHTKIGQGIWPNEIYRFFHDHLIKAGSTLSGRWGLSQIDEEQPRYTAKDKKLSVN
jgi:anaerobic magnesium-protoporphyrin IX monomethyl ester cyclase